MKLIYVAHPFSGKQENVEKAERILRRLMREYSDYVFYSPLHATGYYYHDVPYDKGMEHCLEMLRRCDELWLCEGWEDSRGCSIEYSYAKGTGMPICEVRKGELPNYREADCKNFNANVFADKNSGWKFLKCRACVDATYSYLCVKLCGK